MFLVLAQPDEIVLPKVTFSFVRAIFVVFRYIVSLPHKITPKICFSKPYSRFFLFFKHNLKLCTFLLKVERDEFGPRRRKASPFTNPVFMPLSV